MVKNYLSLILAIFQRHFFCSVVQDESERVSFKYLCRGYVCIVWSKNNTLSDTTM